MDPSVPHDRAELTRRRAFEAVVWGMPAVNFERMLTAMTALGGRLNEVVYWSHLLDWRNQTLTPNPDTLYFLPFFDLAEGPMVLEIPPADGGSITGSIMDAWQCALADVGPAGADEGRGGRYLLMPSDASAEPPPGYVALSCDTRRGYAVLRSNIASGSEADVAAAADYGRRIRLYPLSLAADPPPTAMVDASGDLFDSLIPYDAEFFTALNSFVQAEPWLRRDQAMIHLLASCGIVRGRDFTPDPTLADVPAQAREFLDARYESLFNPPFYPGTHWAVPVPVDVIHGQADAYADPQTYPVDDRAVLFSIAYFSAKYLGAGQFYLLTISDADGRPLEGRNSYRLTVAPDVPVELYWSATVYDRETHALIRELPRSSRASTSPGLQVNADGSTDIHLGATAPDGAETNWIPTDPAGRFEVLFRFYGPTPALAEKSWRLPDVQRQPH